MINRTAKSQFLGCILLLAASARAAELNLLAMGDWGNNGPGQRMVAATIKSYVQSSGAKFSAMLLAGDNFYVPLDNIFDPKWKTMFEDLYEKSVFDFPFYPALGN